ncbi:M20/M25/M40 family metallo-hydrolase [Sphingomonas koreensis]|nr:M20/M25/M40 family metallo-hydrolase [Sphingomonas koreensis]
MRRLLATVAAIALATPALAQSSDSSAISRIIDEGSNHSQVMPIAEHLADVIGPRLTNSPGMRQAEDWTQAQFRDWGLANVHKEGFDFGRGWSIVHSRVAMVSPRPIDLVAIPIAWTPGTNGVIQAPIVAAPIKRVEDFADWRGKLAGKIVLVSRPDDGSEPSEAPFQRLSDADIAKLDHYDPAKNDPAAREKLMTRIAFTKQLDDFLKSEGALAYATESRTDGKLIHGEGYRYEVGNTAALPAVEIAAEDYRRLARLSKVGPAPVLSIDNEVHFDDSDPQAYDIIAEIPGSDPKAGYVMAGAHLDSWVAGDGASDNGAGSAMVMEAARILAATGVHPRRTIRFALWAGEEQGLLGSQAYVERHLATRGSPNDPSLTGLAKYFGWQQRFPIHPKPEWGQLSAYFNIDNGSGKLRGLYAENNPGAAAVFREWLSPFAAMGAGHVVMSRTGSTDHVFFQSVGVPGFQFIQDPLDYESRVHHSNIDTFDHMKGDDMRQGATVLAGVLLDAANADKALPRPPLPTEPVVTDPFAWPEAN